MSSAWGNSWASAWGNAWGSVGAATIGGHYVPRRKRRHADPAEQYRERGECLRQDILIAFGGGRRQELAPVIEPVAFEEDGRIEIDWDEVAADVERFERIAERARAFAIELERELDDEEALLVL